MLQLSDTPAYLAAGWNGAIDAIVVSSGFQGSYVMDDLSFESAAPVPEPGSMTLMLAGLGLVGYLRLRRSGRGGGGLRRAA